MRYGTSVSLLVAPDRSQLRSYAAFAICEDVGPENTDGAAAGPLGLIHGLIGSVGQVFGPPAVVGARGNADAGIYRDLPARLPQMAVAGRRELAARLLWDPLQRTAFFGSSIANSSPPSLATRAFSGEELTQAASDSNEERIAGRVAERVIDGLEAVEIDKENRALAPAAPDLSQRRAGKLKEHPAIWQTSQRHPSALPRKRDARQPFGIGGGVAIEGRTTTNAARLRKTTSVKNSSSCHSSCLRAKSAIVLATLKCAEAAQATIATAAHADALELSPSRDHEPNPIQFDPPGATSLPSPTRPPLCCPRRRPARQEKLRQSIAYFPSGRFAENVSENAFF